MLGTVSQITNFTIYDQWYFTIEDDNNTAYYLMAENFYKSHRLKDPVTKRELDNLWIDAKVDFESLEGINVITRLNKWPV